MSKLQLVLGSSGSGKSEYVYQEITRRALEEPKRNFLIIVPDQFTMETQQRLVKMSPRNGILNIDVLSFGRLTHRILQETGRDEMPVLDDTGKSLVLQKVAGDLESQMPLLGRRMHKQGYISEVKSALSEFMTYGYQAEKMDELIAAADGEKRPSLAAKLRDLKVIYKGFEDYISGHYITREGRLDLLRTCLPKSAILPESVLVFDGFTGFTPIQEAVISDLMHIVDEIFVSLLLRGESKGLQSGVEDLCHLTEVTKLRLEKMAKEQGVEILKDIYVSNKTENPMLAHLEQNLFSYPSQCYTNEKFQQESSAIRLMEISTPANEAHEVALEIAKLIRDKKTNYRYRDIAVVCGDLETMAPYLRREFISMGIPFFVDKTSGVRLNPIVELVRALLQVYIQNFSKEAVMHYLHTGVILMDMDEMDLLEVYLRETGIRGKTAWGKKFVRHSRTMREMINRKENSKAQELLELVERCRMHIMEDLNVFGGAKKDSARNYVNRLYDFCIKVGIPEAVEGFRQEFEALGDLSRSREFAQIYPYLITLLEQIEGLLGEEELTLTEFAEIMDAGFGEMRVGSIPATVDQVLIGDFERSRLKSVKALFVMSVNDVNIPGGAGSGGILSDLDREYLADRDILLAPTPREAMFSQRLYLYQNLTKPTEKLYLSWTNMDAAGKTIRKSYLIEMVAKMYPQLEISHPEQAPLREKIVTMQEGMRYLAKYLREYVLSPNMPEEEKKQYLSELYTLYAIYSKISLGETGVVADYLKSAAFKQWKETLLPADSVGGLFDEEFFASVSCLETYASCPYRFFLQYALRLRETSDYEITSLEKGSVIHSVLEMFSRKLSKDRLCWNNFEESYLDACLPSILEEAIAKMPGGAVFFENARNTYVSHSLTQLLRLNILRLREQAKDSGFAPVAYEKKFYENREIELEDGRHFLIKGSGVIDRIDTVKDGDATYLRITDYKSSKHEIFLRDVYTGTALQLPYYLSKQLQEYKANGESYPAAMLYYAVDAPILELKKEVSPEQLEKMIAESFRMSGYVASDEKILQLLDDKLTPGNTSAIVPVTLKKDGNPDSYSKAIAVPKFDLVLEYSEWLADRLIRQILNGQYAAAPYGKEPCKYCAYKQVCPKDSNLPGFAITEEVKLSDEEVLAAMANAMADGEIRSDDAEESGEPDDVDEENV